MRILLLSVLFFSYLNSVFAIPSLVPAPPRINAGAYLLIDHHSGYVLAEHNADEQIEPASLTKLMTAYVVLYEIARGGISLDDQVKVSEKAWRMRGSRMFIEVNTLVSVEKLLKGLIVHSGNDAAIALAEHTASNETAFVELMNQHAARLGMNATHFKNSTGWPDSEHITTARDLAKLSRAIINDFPEHYTWYKIKNFKYNNIAQDNRNRLLWLDKRVDGLKTGHTDAAGYCLISSAIDNNMRLISIVTGTSKDAARIAASRKLLNYGFRFFETRLVYKANSVVTKMRVWKGDKKELSLGTTKDLYITSPKGSANNVKKNIKVEAMIEAPVEKGQHYGQISLVLDNRQLASQPLVSLSAIKKGGIWRKLVDNIQLLFQ